MVLAMTICGIGVWYSCKGNKNNTEWNKRMLIETEAGGGDPELDFQGILTVLQTSWNELKGYGKENIFFHKHLWMTEGNGLIESTILL